VNVHKQLHITEIQVPVLIIPRNGDQVKIKESELSKEAERAYTVYQVLVLTTQRRKKPKEKSVLELVKVVEAHNPVQ